MRLTQLLISSILVKLSVSLSHSYLVRLIYVSRLIEMFFLSMKHHFKMPHSGVTAWGGATRNATLFVIMMLSDAVPSNPELFNLHPSLRTFRLGILHSS